MSSAADRQRVLATLLLLTLLVGTGLLFWGPTPVSPATHHYADARAWLGIPNACNVLVNLPLFWLAVWGWCVTRASNLPRALRLPWQWFHLFTMTTALSAAVYHAAPSNAALIVSHVGQSGAFTALALCMLAERVDARFGSALACAAGALLAAFVGAAVLLASSNASAADMRALVLIESIPLLLVPAGALGLRGLFTHSSNWLVLLALYGFAKLFDVMDAGIFELTGGAISGHSLMHVNLAIAVGWAVYFASAARADTASSAVGPGSVQRHTSLNTSA